MLFLFACTVAEPPPETPVQDPVVEVDVETCDNGSDDDADGLVDCEDGDCMEFADCDGWVWVTEGEFTFEYLHMEWDAYSGSDSTSGSIYGTMVSFDVLRGALRASGELCSWQLDWGYFYAVGGDSPSQEFRRFEPVLSDDCPVQTFDWMVPTHSWRTGESPAGSIPASSPDVQWDAEQGVVLERGGRPFVVGRWNATGTDTYWGYTFTGSGTVEAGAGWSF